MNESDREESESGEAADAPAFDGSSVQPDESVLDAIRRTTGAKPAVLLRDLDEGSAPSPVMRVPTGPSEQAVTDDHRYQFLGEIARGAIGVVMKGRDKDLGREVAIKVLKKELVDHPDALERFVEEAQIEGQLQHPGIPPIYGLGQQEDARPQFAMKLVKGKTLSALLEERLDPGQSRQRMLGILERVCTAMAYVHARGVIHRDLKPSNIMVGAFGEAQVLDWGFAKILGREDPKEAPGRTVISTVRSGEGSSRSIAGSVMGTPAYMPPEQALGHVDTLDPRADVFALGAILCEILTGQPPYVARDTSDLLVMAAQAKLEDAFGRIEDADADSELKALAFECLDPLRGDRPQSAGEVGERLAAYLAGVDERVRRSAIDVREAEAQAAAEELELEQAEARAGWERRARVRTLVISAGVLVAVGLAVGGFVWHQRGLGAQRERTRHAVDAVADETMERIGQERFEGARAALARAETLLATGESDDVSRRRVRDLRVSIDEREAEVEARVAQHARESTLDAKLADAFARASRDPEAARLAYAPLADLVDEEPSHELPAGLPGWGIAERLAFHLTELAWLERTADTPMVLAAVERVDPDPVRTQIRQALVDGDLPTVRAAADAPPDDVMTIATIGHALLRLGDHVRARSLLGRGFVDHPADGLGALLLADAHAAAVSPDWNAVAYSLARSRVVWPESEVLRSRHVASLLRGAGVSTALPEMLDKGVVPTSRQWVQFGGALLEQGENAEARRAFQRAIDGAPDSADQWLVHGRALLELFQDPEGASRAFEEAVRLAPDRDEAYRLLGAARIGLGDAEAAIAAFTEACSLAPGVVANHDGLAGAWEHIDRFDRSRAVVEDALRVLPNEPSLHFRLGRALYAAFDLDGAKAAFDKVLLHDPAYFQAHTQIGVVHATRDEVPEAVAAFRAAARGMPKNGDVQFRLSEMLLHSGETGEAYVTASRAADRLAGLPEQTRRARDQIARALRVSSVEPALGRLAASDPLPDQAIDLTHALAALYFDYSLLSARIWERVLAGDRSAWDSTGVLDPRRRAAQAAVRCGSGEGRDARALSSREEGVWRTRARSWLRADLVQMVEAIDDGDDRERRITTWLLRKWQVSRAFRSVRDADALARLDPTERQAWERFWVDVASTIRAAEERE